MTTKAERVVCEKTGNPCGTDTWAVGEPCICPSCCKWLSENQTDMPPEFQKVVDDNFWDLCIPAVHQEETNDV